MLLLCAVAGCSPQRHACTNTRGQPGTHTESGSSIASEASRQLPLVFVEPCIEIHAAALVGSLQDLLLAFHLRLQAPSPSLSLPVHQDQGSCKPNSYIKKELEKYLEQKLLTVHPCSVLALILNQEMALNSRSKHRNWCCQHRNQK